MLNLYGGFNTLYRVFCFFKLFIIGGKELSGSLLTAYSRFYIHVSHRGDTALQRTAIEQFIELPYSYGWDKEYGGLYYFLDTGGYNPIQVGQENTMRSEAIKE